jgi:hypothetical protein
MERGDVDLQDIATGLARTIRFGRQTTNALSVAEHCVNLTRIVPRAYQAAALLHDAAEAYMGDAPAPLREAMLIQDETGRISTFEDVEGLALETIFAALGVAFPTVDQWKQLMRFDHALRAYEAFVLGFDADMPCGAEDFMQCAIGLRVECWGPEEAERRYLARAAELGIGRG